MTNIKWNTNRGVMPYRFLVVGAPNVGKTELINQWIQDNDPVVAQSINSLPLSKHQISIQQKLVVLNGGESLLAIELWEVPSSVATLFENIYLPTADGAIIVCDATDVATFSSINTWQQKFIPNQIPAIVCVNKCDSKLSRVAPRMIDESARAFKCVKGFRTSTVERINIDESLFALLNHCQRIEQGDAFEIHTPSESVTNASIDQLNTSRQSMTPEISRTQAHMSMSHTAISSRVPNMYRTTRATTDGGNNASVLMRSRINRILKR